MDAQDFVRGMRAQHDLLSTIKGVVVGLDRKSRPSRSQGAGDPSPCDLLVRSLALNVLALARGDGSDADLLAFAKKHFDVEIDQIPRPVAKTLARRESIFINKATVSPGQTTVAGWAAEIIGVSNANTPLSNLAPRSVYTSLSNRGLRVAISGNGSVKFPARATGTLAGGFVGEASAIKVGKASLTSNTLTPHKLGIISEYTEELGLYGLPAIEQILRQGISEDTQNAVDAALLDAAAGSAIRPPGLLNGLSSLTPTPIAAGPLNALGNDIGSLAASIPQANDFAVLMNAAERSRAITLAPALASLVVEAPSLPSKRIVGIDCADLATIEDDSPRFVVSTEATIHEEDVPLPLSAVGTPNVVAAPIRNLFQTDAIAIRMTLFCGWLMRRSNRLAFTDGVLW
jgi:hypothetical protein